MDITINGITAPHDDWFWSTNTVQPGPNCNNRYWMEHIVLPALPRMMFAGRGPYVNRSPWRP